MEQEPKGRSKPLGIADLLFAEMRQAVQDIRQKVVEEGWFGRVVTAAPVVEAERDNLSTSLAQNPVQSPDHRHTFEELWGASKIPEPSERDTKQELGIDR